MTGEPLLRKPQRLDLARLRRERERRIEKERAAARRAPAPNFVATFGAGELARCRRCVYALLDPRLPDLVAYVGMTTGHPLVRLEGHLREAERRRDRRQGLPIPRRTRWLQELLAAGVLPTLAVLEVVPEAQSIEDCEQWWIRFYVFRGEAAMNGQMRFACANGMQQLGGP